MVQTGASGRDRGGAVPGTGIRRGDRKRGGDSEQPTPCPPPPAPLGLGVGGEAESGRLVAGDSPFVGIRPPPPWRLSRPRPQQLTPPCVPPVCRQSRSRLASLCPCAGCCPLPLSVAPLPLARPSPCPSLAVSISPPPCLPLHSRFLGPASPTFVILSVAGLSFCQSLTPIPCSTGASPPTLVSALIFSYPSPCPSPGLPPVPSLRLPPRSAALVAPGSAE